jgi:hypothetical protein
MLNGREPAGVLKGGGGAFRESVFVEYLYVKELSKKEGKKRAGKVES